MRKYNQPQTRFLQVVNSSIICTSGGPAKVSIQSVTKTDGEW